MILHLSTDSVSEWPSIQEPDIDNLTLTFPISKLLVEKSRDRHNFENMWQEEKIKRREKSNTRKHSGLMCIIFDIWNREIWKMRVL